MRTAIVPVAGKGTRLGNVGTAIPKALVPYKNRPTIDYIFEMLQIAGIERVVLIVGWKKEAIVSYLEDGASFGLDIAYVIQPKPNGIANAILRAEPFVKDRSFVIMFGDTLLFPKTALEIFEGETNTVMVTEISDPTKHGMVRYTELGDQKILEEIVEKPTNWNLNKDGNLGSCGVYRFTQQIFHAIRKTEPNQKTGELEISDAINKAIALRRTNPSFDKIKLKKFGGTYLDMGKV